MYGYVWRTGTSLPQNRVMDPQYYAQGPPSPLCPKQRERSKKVRQHHLRVVWTWALSARALRRHKQ